MHEKYEKIKKIFKKNGGYARTKDIINAGIHTSYLYQLEEKNVINKIKRGLYYWDNGRFNETEELVKVNKIIPNGVFCLISALSYYKLTTYNPWEHYVAIHRDAHKPALPDYPPIKVFYFSEKQFKTGIKEIKINNNTIKIYDLEKTVCDCIRFRNKIGMDVAKDALNEYLKRKDKNINQLLKYAEITGIQNLMQNYLEILV
ncbi:type IV toxin-antitoxin system AbiEi family antitoxin domain-containing protein [Halanaerobaculum tunisiense]